MLFNLAPLSALAVVATLLSVSARTLPPLGPNSKSSELVQNRYIVEFDSAAYLQSANLKKRDTAIHEAMYSQMRARGIAISVNQEYTADLFVGASISISSEADLASIASLEGVLNILPVRVMQLPRLTNRIQAAGWTRADPSTLTPISLAINRTQSTKRQTTGGRRNTGFSNLPQIKADVAQAKGFKGKGIKIGIIDGGVDYTRTPLGGCFGPGCKVAGGYDFVGDNFNATTQPQPDADPIDKCDIHGTIVAGIIGANDNEYNVPGVAPEATLFQYRAYSCTGYSTEDVIFQAMQRAYIEDMDIVNLSIELRSGWTETALSVMASRLVQAGTVVAAAAGNVDVEDNGPFFASAPASGRGVISAGSTNNTILPAHNATTSTGYGPITYYNYKNFADGTYPIYTYPNNPTGCDAPVVDLRGVVLVVREGGACNYSIRAMTAFESGAQGILFALQQDGVEPTYENFPLIDNGRVSKADGDWLFANSGRASLTFTWNPVAQPNTFSGGIGWEVSGTGPTYELFMSTQVMTPGTNIIGVSPFDVSNNLLNWTITPGTSWSSAFASGSAALYLGAKGTRNVRPRDVREALQAASNPIQYSKSDSQLHTVAYQGAGQLQVFDSINFATTVSPSELYLNDTQFFAGEQKITITNNGNDRLDYTLTHLPAGTALALNPANNFTNYWPIPQVNQPATVRFSDTSFRLNKGKSKDITVKFTYPNGVDPKTLPIVSGYIQVSTGSQISTVPYMGVAQRMRDVPVFDSSFAYFETPDLKLPVVVDGTTGARFNNNPTFNFQGSSYPGLYYRTAGGSKVIYFDLVRADVNLNLTPNFVKRDNDGAGALVARKTQSNDGDWSTALTGIQKLLCRITNNRLKFCAPFTQQSSFSKVPVVGTVFERRLVTRDTNDYYNGYQTFLWQTPQFSNGTRAPNGNYRLLLRGLHVFGDPSKQEDYETYLSPPFTIAA